MGPIETSTYPHCDSVPVGGTTSVSMQLSRYDLSFWDVVSQRWTIPAGTTGVSVGASSRDIRLKGSITA